MDLVDNDGAEEVRETVGTVPTFYEMQGAIAEAALRCGKQRGRHRAKLPKDHPAQKDLEEAISLRSVEHGLFGEVLP